MIMLLVAVSLICPLTKLSLTTDMSLLNWQETDFLTITNENPWISQVCDQDHKTYSTEECSWAFPQAAMIGNKQWEREINSFFFFLISFSLAQRKLNRGQKEKTRLLNSVTTLSLQQNHIFVVEFEALLEGRSRWEPASTARTSQQRTAPHTIYHPARFCFWRIIKKQANHKSIWHIKLGFITV